VLLVSVAALTGLSGRANPTMTLASSIGLGRREALGAAAGLALLSVAAVVLGAPSGALIAGVAATVLGVSLLLPTLSAETAARDELERAVAGLMATGLAIAVSFTRIEAREAALWAQQPTRAARVAEIITVQAEKTATTAIAVVALSVVAAIEILRIRRLLARRAPPRPSTGTTVLLALLLLAIAGDVIQHGRFIGTRDELRAEIAAQFSHFARLDPPSGDELDPDAYPPHRSTALHVTRDAVAVNSKGVAKLAALESKEVSTLFGQDLSRTLAQAAVEQEGAAEVDLSVFVDREVPWSAVLKLLAIARASGVKRVDLMLTRGPTPPRSTAPEAQIVIPSDFVALPLELSGDGFTAPESARFGEVAPRLVGLAKPGEPAIRLAIPQ
jgi:hypothetical protein